MDIKKLKEKKASLLSKMESIVEKAEDTLTEEEQKAFDEAKADFDKTVKSIETAELLEKSKQDAKTAAPILERVVPDATREDSSKIKAVSLPATVRKSHSLRAFSGQDANEKAYSFGMFIRSCNGDFEASRWCNEHGIDVSKFAVHNSGTDSTGGYLVPTQFSSDMAQLLYQYGVARKNCKVQNLTTDTFNRPKRVAGLTAYPTAESAQITESTKEYGNIQLTVKDWSIITRMTRQLSQDALINVADDLMGEIAYQFAYAEDNCLFNGDGTSDYASITGLGAAITTASADPSTNPYAYDDSVASASLALSDITALMGAINGFSLAGAKWFVNSNTFYSRLINLGYATSGTSVTNVVAGITEDKFMGKPVVFCDVLSDDVIYFGNLTQAADFGDRSQYAIDFSDSAYVGGQSVFERNQIAVRGFERFDINVHSVGDNGEPAPIGRLTIT